MNKASQDTGSMPMGFRQSGKDILRDAITRLRDRADSLETIYKMLPESPTPEQDAALWSIAVEFRR